MSNKNTRGSEWRKWDLHVHTASSHLNNSFGNITNDDFINKVVDSDISAIGLTNYFNFTDRDYELKEKLAKKDIVVFLNLELRLTYQNKEDQCCDIHVIFDNTVEKNVIQTFLSNLTIKVNGQEKKANVLSSDNDFRNATIEFEHLKESLDEQALNLQGRYLLGFLSRGHGNGRTSTQYEQLANDCHLLIHSSNSQQNVDDDRTFWLQHNKPLLQSSDAHSIDQIGSKFTWIKADPTFEGLKQILFEPEERVKIQENNPEFDFEKSPITEILITSPVKLFAKDEEGNDITDDDNISFSPMLLPLNNSMVSIIGGRGTGKSRLIDYIAVGLGKSRRISASYTQSSDVVVKHKASLLDTTEQTFTLSSHEKQFPFMYISQSEIKEIVENSTEFSKKIRELIGIPQDYQISESITLEAKQLLNEYVQLFDSLYADGTSSEQKKNTLDIEITQNQNFIKNVTSEENKARLEEYKQSLETLHRYQQIKSRLEQLKNKINNYQIEINDEIKSLSLDIDKISSQNFPISQINNQETIDSIDKAIETMTNFVSEEQKKINDTKNKFPNYSGNLATLLDNIQSYQNSVVQLQAQKNKIVKNENRFNEIIKLLLKQLGEQIKEDINQYKSNVEAKWNSFISGNDDFTNEQKKLLANVLGKNRETENITIEVSIIFDKKKLIDIISHEMDKRTRIANDLDDRLGIDSFDTYLDKITKKFDINIFGCDHVYYTKHLLAVLYTRYTEFISHKIDILINKKPLKKLSVGQRGTAYLRLQLAANLLTETIIYDQPEDDLDNDFITNSLVDLFKEIKKYRQVIIVSHNANLVVNADSEQVIVAQNNDGTLSYKSGALESPDINKEICRILEGGQEAFEKREKKYGFTK